MDGDLTENKVVAVIQARMSSSRLPGKALLMIGQTPSVLCVLGRVARANAVDELILATSSRREDLKLVKVVEDAGYLCFRGSLKNVLMRTFAAAEILGAKHVVRIPGDKILVDPKEITRVVCEHVSAGHDYTANFFTGHPFSRLIPLGLEVEVFKLSALERAISLDLPGPEDREHVTSVFYNNPGYFKLGYSASASLRPFSRLRVNLDEEEDLRVIRSIYQSVGPEADSDICLGWLRRNKNISQINSKVEQNPLPSRQIST